MTKNFQTGPFWGLATAICVTSLVVCSVFWTEFLVQLPNEWNVSEASTKLGALALSTAIALCYALVVSGPTCVIAAIALRLSSKREEPFRERFWPSGVRPIISGVYLIATLLIAIVFFVVIDTIGDSVPSVEKFTTVAEVPAVLTALVFAAAAAKWRPAIAPGFWIGFVLIGLVPIRTFMVSGTFFIPHDMGWAMLPWLVVASLFAITAWASRIPNAVIIATNIAVLAATLFGFFYPTDGKSHAWLMDETALTYPAIQTLRLVVDPDIDGYSSWFDHRDCAPFDAEIHMGALEEPGNGVDENCVGGDGSADVPTVQDGDLTIENPLNVIVISVDTLRHDALGLTLNDQPVAPAMTLLANKGVRFTHAYSASTHTNESIPSLFSGAYPSDWLQSGLYFGMEPPIPRMLQSLGYQTFGVISIPFLSAAMLDGFDTIDNQLGFDASHQTNSEQLTERALERIAKRDPQKPFFAWIHYFDPHAAFLPYENAHSVGFNPYWQEVERVDDAIERLMIGLDQQNVLARSVIVLVSDHGEGLGAKKLQTHMWKATEQVIRIPFVIRVPGIPPREISQPVSTVDLAPTLASILGMKNLSPRNGVSLLPLMVGMDVQRGPVFFEASYGGPLVRGVVSGDHKYWYDWKRDAYYLHNIRTDPEDRVNLLGDPIQAGLHQTLWEWWDVQYGLATMKYRATRWKPGVRQSVVLPDYVGPELHQVTAH